MTKGNCRGEEAGLACPQCGVLNRSARSFCAACGRVLAAPIPPQVIESPNPEPRKRSTEAAVARRQAVEPEPDRDAEDGYSGPELMWFTGLTYRQLDYWDTTGLLRPSISVANGSGSQRRYSIGDVRLARTMKRLLDAGVSLQRIRGVGAALAELPEDADAFAVIGDEVTVVRTGEELAAAVMATEIVHVVRLEQVEKLARS